MDGLSLAILKNFRLGIQLTLKDSANEFEKKQLLKYMHQRSINSWNRSAGQLNRLINSFEPLSHILNNHHFASTELNLRKGVLIPRVETEHMVSNLVTILQQKRKSDVTLRILDLCTGSGCIGIALACSLTNSQVLLVDKSYKCCRNAKENVVMHASQIKALGSQVEVMRLDVLDSSQSVPGQFDIIISNPPYIPKWRTRFVDKSVISYEDTSSLFPPSNKHKGLQIHKEILTLAHTKLRSNSSYFGPKIILEFDGAYQIPSLLSILRELDIANYKIKKDLFGVNRFLWIF